MEGMLMSEALLKTVNLQKTYSRKQGWFDKPRIIKALTGVDLSILPGETFGVVGESGCGKSTLGMTIAKLIEPDAGEIYFNGRNITKLSEKEMHGLRKSMQVVFQDPFASLNPRMSIHDILAEPLIIQKMTGSRAETDSRVSELLQQVGLDMYCAHRYPHEFSGGQRQRIGIARALAVNPSLIIADEPVSALDVSIQAQILNLLCSLRQKFSLTYIFISHDLSVVEYISDRIGVMYLGNFVEISDKNDLFRHPLHPYTQALLSAIPVPDPAADRKKRIILSGNTGDIVKNETGCRFYPRCFKRMPVCAEVPPGLIPVSPCHCVSCHLYD